MKYFLEDHKKIIIIILIIIIVEIIIVVYNKNKDADIENLSDSIESDVMDESVENINNQVPDETSATKYDDIIYGVE